MYLGNCGNNILFDKSLLKFLAKTCKLFDKLICIRMIKKILYLSIIHLQ